MESQFKRFLFLVLCFLIPLQVSAQELNDYVRFLGTQTEEPVEYFVNLFDDHRIVVFCEGLHPELAQYEFLMKVVAHPKFSEKVRAVFTEIGSSQQQFRMDEFLSSTTLSLTPLLKLNRENTFHPMGWSSGNIIRFWEQIWKVNSRLASERRIWVFPSDIPWDWSKILSKADYDAAWNCDNAVRRDLFMANLIADRIDAIQKNLPSDPNKKDRYLVIMNTRHAMGYAVGSDGKFGDNCGRFLKDKFGKKEVYNVLFHQQKAIPVDGNRGFIQEGKWDAAFFSNGWKPVGFALAGSPFGKDSFDYHSRFQANCYSDVFDGFVFTEPLSKYRKQDSAPGFYDREFLVEVDRRCKAAEKANVIQKLVDQHGLDWVENEWPKTVEGIGITEKEYQKEMEKWLK